MAIVNQNDGNVAEVQLPNAAQDRTGLQEKHSTAFDAVEVDLEDIDLKNINKRRGVGERTPRK